MGDDDNGVPDLSNRRLLQVLMQEIADVRLELKEEIAGAEKRLTMRMDSFEGKLNALASDMKGLRTQVHQNHHTFLKNHEDLERRVAVLEAAA